MKGETGGRPEREEGGIVIGWWQERPPFFSRLSPSPAFYRPNRPLKGTEPKEAHLDGAVVGSENAPPLSGEP